MTRSTSFNDWLRHATAPVEAVLLDIDGVLLNSKRRLPGSRKLVDILTARGLAYLLVTNDGNHSTEEKAGRLQEAGLPISRDHIVSCGHAIAPLVHASGLDGQLFFVMGDTGTPCYAETAGLQVTRDLRQLKRCAGVIVGEENYEWEPVINAVINYFIDRPAAPLIIPNPDEFYPAPELTIHVAAGGIGRFMQRVLDTYGVPLAPTYLGKPYPPVFQLAHDKLMKMAGRPIASQKIVMVGDNLSADIAGGKAMGYTTALMLSGVTSAASLETAGPDEIPDMVFEGL